MSKEQNIDDILKLLKDSVSTETLDTIDEQPISEKDMSTELLQESLKSKYIDTEISTEELQAESAEKYILDSDFLTELEELSVPDDPDDRIEPEQVLDPSRIIDLNEVCDENPTFDDQVAIEQVVTDDLEFSEDLLANDEVIQDCLDEELPRDNTDELIAALKPTEDTVSAYEDTPEDTSYEFDEQEQIYADISLEDNDIIEDNITDLSEDIPKGDVVNTTDTSDEEHETFLASMRRTGLDFTAEDMCISADKQNSELDSSDVLGESLSEDSEPIVNDDIDLSTINLMMQFCEKEELERTIGNQKVDDFLKFEDHSTEETQSDRTASRKEFTSPDQTEEILASYKKSKNSAVLSLIICSLIGVISFIYELIPRVGGTSGLLDYTAYPAVYALIGLQFLVFAGVVYYKQIWHGLKRAFSFSPNKYSIAAIIMSLTVIYDLIVVILLAFTNDELPSMYNTIAIFSCTLCILADLLSISAEARSFGVYSSEAKKYTLIKETEKSSVGSKMYGGGLDPEKSIYSARIVDFPNGFFKSLENRSENKLLTVLLMPALILGIIAAIVSASIGFDAYTASAAFMVCIYSILPVILIVSDIIPYWIACVRLSKRSCAFSGMGAIEKYDKCDIMVFNDLHVFKKCKTEDIGIVVYDNGVGYLTLGCLDAVYQKIGGPLSGMKMNLPDVFKFDNVIFKRISRNGIEAIVDKKHSIIIGDPAYMQRYGLVFPENEQKSDRLTLCVSLNGKVSAKLSVRYEIEPVFEMLAERLGSEGISCAVQTYDPLINGVMLSRARVLGSSPISVVHGTVEDMRAHDIKRYRNGEDAIISCASRLKLVEVEVWLKKLLSIKKLCNRISVAFSAIGLLAVILLISLGVVGYVDQNYIFIYLVLELIALTIPMVKYLPHKKYFTVEALNSEIEKQTQEQYLTEQKNNKKQIRKSK